MTQSLTPKRRRLREGQRFGRAPANPNAEFFKDKPLYPLLMKGFPQHIRTLRDGEKHLDMTDLAATLGVSRNAVYRWCNGERVRSSSATNIVEKSGEKITKNDLIPFII